MANSSSRNGARVLWVTVHTAEGIRKASDLQAFFNRSVDSSAHAVADNATIIDNLVPYDRAAWTLRNGNSRSDNLELCGFASWSRAQWLDSNQGMLTLAAAWIHRRCTARGIPLVKLTAADVRAGKAGVIGHVDYTNGTGDGTHWDPGPGFPWDVVMSRAAALGNGDDMPLTPDEIRAIGEQVWNGGPYVDSHVTTGVKDTGATQLSWTNAEVHAANATLAALRPNIERIDEIEQRLVGLTTTVTAVKTAVDAILAKLNAGGGA